MSLSIERAERERESISLRRQQLTLESKRERSGASGRAYHKSGSACGGGEAGSSGNGWTGREGPARRADA